MPRMTQKAYAERIGVSAQYVNKLVTQGKIRKIGRLIDSVQADAVIKAFRRAGSISAGRNKRESPRARPRAQRQPLRSPAVPAKAAERLPRTSATRSLTEARAAREHYNAEIAKLEYQKAIGELLPRDQVLDAERRKNANIRARFRRLPRSIAPMLARVSGPAEIEQVLLAEIDLIFGQLARDPLGMHEEVLSVPPPEAPVLEQPKSLEISA